MRNVLVLEGREEGEDIGRDVYVVLRMNESVSKSF